ncbi:trichohyalin-like [Fopius arisanus]|uniref:Trichohyalin-like n=1 Tax=Fopius arisanus TaxID=64838 RepID=A0A9R1TJI8_9HYME|nr:PREDICTED: trichohyalin-like [Fopius arisanus]
MQSDGDLSKVDPVGAKRGRGRPGSRNTTKEKKKSPDTGEGREREITVWTKKDDKEGGSEERPDGEGGETQIQSDTPPRNGKITSGKQLARTPTKAKDEETQGNSEREVNGEERKQTERATSERIGDIQVLTQGERARGRREEAGEGKTEQTRHWEELEWRMEKKWEKWTKKQKELEEEKWEKVFVSLEEMIRREFDRERGHTERPHRECPNCDPLRRKLEEAQERSQEVRSILEQEQEPEKEKRGSERHAREGDKLNSSPESEPREELTSTPPRWCPSESGNRRKPPGAAEVKEILQTGHGGKDSRGAKHSTQHNEEQGEQEEQAKEAQEDFPRKLEPDEWDEERKERRERRKWIKIRGLVLRTKQKKEAMESWFLENLQEKVRVDKVERMEGIEGKNGWRVKLEEMDSKIRILKKKRELKHLHSPVWILDDITEKQKLIQSWIEKQAFKWEKAGKFTRT